MAMNTGVTNDARKAQDAIDKNYAASGTEEYIQAPRKSLVSAKLYAEQIKSSKFHNRGAKVAADEQRRMEKERGPRP